MPWAGEWNTTAEGTPEKVQIRRRGRVPLLERARGGGVDHHRKLLVPERAQAPRAGWLWCRPLVARSHLLLYRDPAALVQAVQGKKPLGHLGETGHFLCRLLVARYLLCVLRASGG